MIVECNLRVFGVADDFDGGVLLIYEIIMISIVCKQGNGQCKFKEDIFGNLGIIEFGAKFLRCDIPKTNKLSFVGFYLNYFVSHIDFVTE